MTPELFQKQLSAYAAKGQPCLFVVDFECRKPFICPLEEAAQNGVYYDFNGNSNIGRSKIKSSISIESLPVDKTIFTEKFARVISELQAGNTYLLNLTFPSEIRMNLTLEDVFCVAEAPFKLLFKNEFAVFSPECFIRTIGDEVFTYPMKGTINANIENAERKLLENKKEEWEHNTIVDLMRNDLSMIAGNITVSKYRYIDRIKTHKNEILQTSSEIKGALPVRWRNTLGEDIMKLLPAGSISGAPKQKTVEIIKENEISPRGYYTGIFGIFDGENLESAVAIRFIEARGGKFYFRSGGGITSNSIADEEYDELIQKIYVPAV